VPGVELSTGSLGHGLPFGVGVALSEKRDGNRSRVFVVLSDGELNEGSNWEAFLVAAHHGLSNIDVFIDRNRLQSLTDTESTLAIEPLEQKLKSFGWQVVTIDGHNHSELTTVIERQPNTGKPRATIYNTVKGQGVSFMENSVT